MHKMKDGYYITTDGKKTELFPPARKNEVLDVFSRCIKELVVPEGYKEVWCSYNQLTSLVLPEGVEYVSCNNNQLTSLELSEGVETVSCENNQLTSLVLPEGIQKVSCDNNQLTSLVLPNGIRAVWCDISVKLINLNEEETEAILYANK